MQKTLYILLAVIALALSIGCSDGERRRKTRQPLVKDSLYTPYRAMEVYGRDPERALVIIDSAEVVGNVSDFYASLLRAKVYSRSQEILRLDTARVICEALLEHDSVMANPDLHAEVLDQLVNVSRIRHDGESWLHWATERADLLRKQGTKKTTQAERDYDETEALRAETEVGVVLTSIGQMDEGLARLDYIISKLDHPGSVNRFDALMIALKRKVNVYQQHRRPAEVIPLAQLMLSRIEQFELHPDLYASDSKRLPDAADRARYLEFCRAQAWGFLADAYVRLGDKASARHFINLYEQSDHCQTFVGRRQVTLVWLALGDYDKALASFDEQERQMGDDTIREDYALILIGRADMAQAQGRLAEAIQYNHRYEILSDSLHSRLQESKAHDYAVRYQLQEQRVETERQKMMAAHRLFFAIAICIALLLALAGLLWYRRQQRAMSRKNHSLVEQITEALKYKKRYDELKSQMMATTLRDSDATTSAVPDGVRENSADDAAHAAIDDMPATPVEESAPEVLSTFSDDRLFEYLHDAIKRDRLYLNPAFDRQTVVDSLHLPKERIGKAFTQGSDYNSLSDFIRECRLEHACELLSTTDMPIGEIAEKSGFSRVTTFNHDFKMKYNVSPSVFRQQLPGLQKP